MFVSCSIVELCLFVLTFVGWEGDLGGDLDRMLFAMSVIQNVDKLEKMICLY